MRRIVVPEKSPLIHLVRAAPNVASQEGIHPPDRAGWVRVVF
jgi:hypothetical protein